MDITIQPNKLRGTVTAIPSKSQAHRLLICAAFADGETTLFCPHINRDILATADCLRALGASVIRTDIGFENEPQFQQNGRACSVCAPQRFGDAGRACGD